MASRFLMASALLTEELVKRLSQVRLLVLIDMKFLNKIVEIHCIYIF
jgi:hypothetical protein